MLRFFHRPCCGDSCLVNLLRKSLPFAALLLATCTGGTTTQLVLVMDTDFRGSIYADSLKLTAGSLGPTGVVGQPLELSFAMDGQDFPLTHGIVRTGGTTQQMLLVLEAMRGDKTVARTSTIAEFQSGQSNRVVLHLSSSCLGVICPGFLSNSVCRDGACSAVAIAPAMPWDGFEPRIEICNNADDNGNGIADDGIVFRSPLNCFECGAVCESAVCGRTGCTTSPITQLAAGGSHACALHSDGVVSCWGNATAGATGSFTQGGLARADAVAVDAAQAIAAGQQHTCAALMDGRAACWGANTFGQLGDGTFDATPLPKAVMQLGNVAAITAGAAHNLRDRLGHGLVLGGQRRPATGAHATELKHYTSFGSPVGWCNSNQRRASPHVCSSKWRSLLLGRQQFVAKRRSTQCQRTGTSGGKPHDSQAGRRGGRSQLCRHRRRPGRMLGEQLRDGAWRTSRYIRHSVVCPLAGRRDACGGWRGRFRWLHMRHQHQWRGALLGKQSRWPTR